MKTKCLLERNLLSYKAERTTGELVIKLKVIREVMREKHAKSAVADRYDMHRNTVSTLCHAFTSLPSDVQNILLKQKPPPEAVILELMTPLKARSTKPHSNKRMATQDQTDTVKNLFQSDKKLAVGFKRMYTLIDRKLAVLDELPPAERRSDSRQGRDTHSTSTPDELACLASLSFGMLKGIYRREGLKVRTVTTYHGERRPLYDYSAIACFEYLHYDTKDIADQKALPKEIYALFKNNPRLPQVEWNIIDAKSRFRFIAYSYSRSSEFGLHFLLFVLCFLRLFHVRVGERITIGMDNGTEFTGGSAEKLDEWNRILAVLQAQAYCYTPGHDVRKNLIERSHLTDDQEFFVPRGEFIHDKRSFIKEARAYATYFNYLRAHSGHGMHDKTPYELLQSKGVYQATSLLKFPVLILEDAIPQIKDATEWIRFESAYNNLPSVDQKALTDLSVTFPLLPITAQNVLTQHPEFYQLKCHHEGKKRMIRCIHGYAQQERTDGGSRSALLQSH